MKVLGGTFHAYCISLSKRHQHLSIFCLVLYNLAFALAWGPVPWLELFPLRARGPASTIAILSNWLFAFAVTKTYYCMSSNLGMQEITGSMLDVVFLGLFMFLFKPETKGKTLEEIEAMFDKVKHGYVHIDVFCKSILLP